jgi:hypothetical protein
MASPLLGGVTVSRPSPVPGSCRGSTLTVRRTATQSRDQVDRVRRDHDPDLRTRFECQSFERALFAEHRLVRRPFLEEVVVA